MTNRVVCQQQFPKNCKLYCAVNIVLLPEEGTFTPLVQSTVCLHSCIHPHISLPVHLTNSVEYSVENMLKYWHFLSYGLLKKGEFALSWNCNSCWPHLLPPQAIHTLSTTCTSQEHPVNYSWRAEAFKLHWFLMSGSWLHLVNSFLFDGIKYFE